MGVVKPCMIISTNGCHGTPIRGSVRPIRPRLIHVALEFLQHDDGEARERAGGIAG
jgi:hypothetical protein